MHKELGYLEEDVKCESDPQVMMSNASAVYNGLGDFNQWYAGYHGYVSLCVCVGGIITNTFNVTVLTRRNMRTPVNQILTGLAVADIITMLSYLPFAAHFYCLHPENGSPEKNSHGWMIFLLFHINITTVTHTVSIWLCVLLAIVRYLHIRSPSRANSARTRRIAQSRYLILSTYFLSSLMMIPNYLTNELTTQLWSSSNSSRVNQTIYVLESMSLGSKDTSPLVLTNVWIYSIFGKIIPCLLISIFGSLLLYQMRAKIQQRKCFLRVSASNNHKLHEHSRTTKMLMTVIALFLITELPQGILIVLSIVKTDFFTHVYMPLGDVMDIIALVNNAINFLLYCTMSTKFRQTFLQLYCRNYHRQCRPLGVDTGYVLRRRLAQNRSGEENML